MLFIALMSIVTTCVAGAAAFFSVYGLAHTFAASFWSVVFMGGSLEAGKLMLASYLYRFKDVLKWPTKSLGYTFVGILMLITSLGIYGYLADAYQSGTTDMKQIGASVELKKQEQASLEKRKTEIDGQIAQVPATDTRGKQRIMKQFGPEVNRINDRLVALTAEIQSESQKQITTDSHVGPIVFVAKVIGMSADNAISLLILMIVFVFDPVAIYLTIATNTAMAKRLSKPKEAPLVEFEDRFDPADLVEVEAPVEPTTEDPIVETKVETIPPDQWELEPKTEVMDLVCCSPIEGSGSQLEELPGLKSPGVPTTMIFDTYYPPPRTAADPEKMKVLGETFSKEIPDDIAYEEGTEDPAVEQLAKIYEEVATKDTSEQTPVDLETMKQIEKFFARQDLVKNVRSGSVE